MADNSNFSSGCRAFGSVFQYALILPRLMEFLPICLIPRIPIPKDPGKTKMMLLASGFRHASILLCYQVVKICPLLLFTRTWTSFHLSASSLIAQFFNLKRCFFGSGDPIAR